MTRSKPKGQVAKVNQHGGHRPDPVSARLENIGTGRTLPVPLAERAAAAQDEKADEELAVMTGQVAVESLRDPEPEAEVVEIPPGVLGDARDLIREMTGRG